MFNFLKKLLVKTEQSHSEIVEIAQLEPWLLDKLAKMKFNDEINCFFTTIADQQLQLAERLTVLKTAQMNPKEAEKVDQRLQNIVLGHRDNYQQQMSLFAERLAVPEQRTLAETLAFVDYLHQELDSLSQRTAKSYSAAQHLFFEPVEAVFKTVAEINLALKEFNTKLEQSGLEKVQDLRLKILTLNDIHEKSLKLNSEQSTKQQRIERFSAGQKEQQQILAELQNSAEYEKYQILEEEIRSMKVLVEQSKVSVFSFFSKLNRPLRKLSHLAPNDQLLSDYLADFESAFKRDNNLQVLNLLQQLQTAIEQHRIELDEKEAEQVLDTISRARGGHLQTIRERAQRLQEELAEKQARLRRFNVDKFIAEAEYKLEHYTAQLAVAQKDAEDFKARIGNYNTEIEKLRIEVMSVAGELFQLQLTITRPLESLPNVQ